MYYYRYKFTYYNQNQSIFQPQRSKRIEIIYICTTCKIRGTIEQDNSWVTECQKLIIQELVKFFKIISVPYRLTLISAYINKEVYQRNDVNITLDCRKKFYNQLLTEYCCKKPEVS